MIRTIGLAGAVLGLLPVVASAEFPAFREQVVNPDAGTGLAIAIADINADGKLDVIGVSSDNVAWYENPAWDRHLIADTLKNSNVCIAAHDLDGDGTPELALGADWQFANTDSGGALYLLYHDKDIRQPWKVQPLVPEEPTLHRIRWADVEGDGWYELIVAPLKGIGSKEPNFQETGARLYVLRPPIGKFTRGWVEEPITTALHVVHNLIPVRSKGETRDDLLFASFEGVTKLSRDPQGNWNATPLVAGNPQPLPNSGVGEIRATFAPGPRMATIEPWHGTQAVVYTLDGETWERAVIDDTLAGGHAVGWADFDSDGEDELMIGFRDKAGPSQRPGLNVYDPSSDGKTWTKHVIDDGGMATEDAAIGDLDGDGLPDIAAFGRATHNIKIYLNEGIAKTP